MVQGRTEELRRAYDRLELLDHTKSDFIKVTSHELRTPLTVLLGYSQMLLQHSTISADAMLAELVAGIYSGAERLHDIVNSMLDIARIDSSVLEINPNRISIGLLVRNVAGNFNNALRQRNLNLNIADTVNSLPQIEADNDLLQKAFYHLLSNAIKYTPDGGAITISGCTSSANGEPGGQAVEIVVSDSGIGIDPEHQELIFAKFYQTGEVALHSSSRTKFKGGGPGLGLSIARGIILAHGGRVWVESPGQDENACPGSHFHVLLPVQPGRKLPENSESPGA